MIDTTIEMALALPAQASVIQSTKPNADREENHAEILVVIDARSSIAGHKHSVIRSLSRLEMF